ncbi:MAG: hypothetical protein HYX56_05865 [Chloroflexi bacterium]|nr:hypothetical protein [Chloroflexota bacterium]
MNAFRGFALLVLALIAGLIGYQVGIAQNIAAQIPAGAAAPYAYPMWHVGFGFFGFLFPLLFLFLIFGLVRAAFGGYGHRGYGMWGDRRARLEELHREMHGEKPRTDTTPT